MKEFKEDPQYRLDEYQKELDNPDMIKQIADRAAHQYDAGYFAGTFYSSSSVLTKKQQTFKLDVIVLVSFITLSGSSFFISENPWLWIGLYIILYLSYLFYFRKKLTNQ